MSSNGVATVRLFIRGVPFGRRDELLPSALPPEQVGREALEGALVLGADVHVGDSVGLQPEQRVCDLRGVAEEAAIQRVLTTGPDLSAAGLFTAQGEEAEWHVLADL